MNKLTGLEVMQAILNGRIEAPTMSATMGFKPTEIGPGCAVFECVPDGRHLNPMGGVHGGYAATVLDTVTGCAVQTTLDAGVSYATVDLAVKMLRGLTPGAIYRAEGRMLHRSTRLGASEGSLFDAQGRLCAHATCTCMILPATPA
ncbi:MAG: PaaI family thioesterase [Panacagrimonas sp.]